MSERIKSFVRWIATIAILSFAIFQLVIFRDLSVMNIWGNVGYACSIAGACAVFYGNYLWKYNPLDKTPRLEKRYEGYMIPSKSVGTRIQTTVTIKQNFFRVFIILQTEESRSVSISSEIVNDSGSNVLHYIYRNQPLAAVRDRSPIHYGSCRLIIDDTNQISGDYWTDRKTTGDISLNSVRVALVKEKGPTGIIATKKKESENA